MKAIIKGHELSLHFDSHAGTFKKQGKEVAADIQKISPSSFSIIINDRSYTAELIESRSVEKVFVIRVNDHIYEVQLKDKYDELLKQLGMDKLFAQKVNDLKAPMPGLVLDVLVMEGQQIKKGDNLLVLEAMKMENNLKATYDATVKKVNVKKGDRVEKNTVLIELS